MKQKLFLTIERLFFILCLSLSGVVSSVWGVDAEQASLGDAVRFLEQATFGPTPQTIAHVQEIGLRAFLDEQVAAPMTPYPTFAFWPQSPPLSCLLYCRRDNYTMYPLQRYFFSNALYGADQLRQRVAFALSQILVASGMKVIQPSWMRPYQQLLYSSAFGNFRQLLYDITLNPAMGRFLDMANSTCQISTPPDPNVCRYGSSSKPNESYAREVLQVFSIGTHRLNQDGTLQLDNQGNPIPTYDQNTVEEFARVLTGWVLAPPLPGPPGIGGTAPNYRDPLRVWVDGAGREGLHDRGEKSLLNGVILPAGQSALTDLNDAIDNIFNHPNVGPFISKQLIQKLVTSNPSPAYVGRVAAVFNDNGTGVRGDLSAVVEAILLDPEARGDVKSDPNYGKLREPALFITGLLRAFNATSDGVLNSSVFENVGSAQMGQDLFRAPSVFNFYSPEYKVPGEAGVLGPEFGILSSITALRRANFVSKIVMNPFGLVASPPDRPLGTQIDLTPYTDLASDPDPTALIDSLDTLLMHGAMSPAMRDIIMTAVTSIPTSLPLQRVRTAVYLIATSSQYQVER